MKRFKKLASLVALVLTLNAVLSACSGKPVKVDSPEVTKAGTTPTVAATSKPVDF